jgi:hypothetical protein
MHQPLEVLGAMIAPAVLISAAALLLLSTAARLGRVNDRLLHLIVEAETLAASGRSEIRKTSEKRGQLTRQMSILRDRLVLLRSSMSALYMTIGLLVLTSLAGGVYVLVPQVTSVFPISIGMLGAIAFLYSIALLIREATTAEHVTLQEIDYACELLQTSAEDGQIT